MSESNSIQDWTDAAQAARGNFREIVRELRASLVPQPLGGERLGTEERRTRYFALSRDPALLASEFDFQREKYGLPNPDKPDHIIPRRLWDGLKAGKREFEKEAE